MSGRGGGERAGALGVGFDVYQNPSDGSANEVSIHFNNAVVGQFSAGAVNLSSGDWIHARIVVRPGGGLSNVSVFLTPTGGSEATIVANYTVAGLVPFESRGYFGARTGGQSAHHDVTNLSITYAGDPAVVGQWSAVTGLPVIPIHSVMLPNQKILFWDRASAGTDIIPRLLNTDGTVSSTPNPIFELFCAGQSLDAQGRAMILGGHDGADGYGLATTFAYDYVTNTFTSHAAMNAGRWYPTNATMANGDTFVIGGSITPGVNNDVPQVFEAKTETYRTLSTASRGLPLYPMMLLAPDGRIFNAGPNQNAAFLNTAGTGTWSAAINSAFGGRDYGSAVMYDAGKVALIGGGYITNTVERIDLNLASPTWSFAAPMAFPRRQITRSSWPTATSWSPAAPRRRPSTTTPAPSSPRRSGTRWPTPGRWERGRGAAALPLGDRAPAGRPRRQPGRRPPGRRHRRAEQLQHGVLLAALPVQGRPAVGDRLAAERRVRPDRLRGDAGRGHHHEGAHHPAGRHDPRL